MGQIDPNDVRGHRRGHWDICGPWGSQGRQDALQGAPPGAHEVGLLIHNGQWYAGALAMLRGGKRPQEQPQTQTALDKSQLSLGPQQTPCNNRISISGHGRSSAIRQEGTTKARVIWWSLGSSSSVSITTSAPSAQSTKWGANISSLISSRAFVRSQLQSNKAVVVKLLCNTSWQNTKQLHVQTCDCMVRPDGRGLPQRHQLGQVVAHNAHQHDGSFGFRQSEDLGTLHLLATWVHPLLGGKKVA